MPHPRRAASVHCSVWPESWNGLGKHKAKSKVGGLMGTVSTAGVLHRTGLPGAPRHWMKYACAAWGRFFWGPGVSYMGIHIGELMVPLHDIQVTIYILWVDYEWALCLASWEIDTNLCKMCLSEQTGFTIH